MVKNLLLVDDDHEEWELFEDAIAMCDPSIQVAFASDGKNAIEYLEKATDIPDIIFLDHNMPIMNGLDCLKLIKSNIKTKLIPTIIYTTTTQESLRKLFLEVGAESYIQKPVTIADLSTELNRSLSLISRKLEAGARK